MKIIFPIALFSMLLVGCQSVQTPTQQLTAYDSTAAVLETALVLADQQHAIPASDRPTVAAALAVLNNDLALANANPSAPTIVSTLARIESDLLALEAFNAKYSALSVPATPTTKGS